MNNAIFSAKKAGQPLLQQLATPLTDEEIKSVNGAISCKSGPTFELSNKELKGDYKVKCRF